LKKKLFLFYFIIFFFVCGWAGPSQPNLVTSSNPAEKWIIIHSYSSMWIIIHSYCSMLVREKKGLTWRRSRMHWCVVGPLFVSLSFLWVFLFYSLPVCCSTVFSFCFFGLFLFLCASSGSRTKTMAYFGLLSSPFRWLFSS
jgi:hypothetical protein